MVYEPYIVYCWIKVAVTVQSTVEEILLPKRGFRRALSQLLLREALYPWFGKTLKLYQYPEGTTIDPGKLNSPPGPSVLKVMVTTGAV